MQADGEQQLKDLGVSVLVTQAVDESVAAGSIIRTDPAAGSQVAAGTTVVIYVSRPQVATTTKVPSLIGMNVNDARTLLVQRKLGLGSQTEQYSDQPVGSIISQNPGEGASAKLNTRVSVVVSAGPEPALNPKHPARAPEQRRLWRLVGRPLRGQQLFQREHRRQLVFFHRRRSQRLVDVLAGLKEKV